MAVYKKTTTLFILVFLILIWELSVYSFNIPAYILPYPTNIFKTTIQNISLLTVNTKTTIFEALLGLLFSAFIGVFTALIFQCFPKIDHAGQPIVAGIQSFPKEAIAPLLIVWFGFGISSKIIMACSISFFPIFLSTLKGLKAVPCEIIYTFSSLRASQRDVILKARLPYSLPYLLSGLRVSATLSIVGAVIGEFVGSSSGLGHLILVANSQFAVDLVFSCLFILGLTGVLVDSLLQQLEKAVIPWHESIYNP